MYLLTSDLITFSLELTYCDGSTAQILTDTKCVIPISELLVAPFNLYWGDSVFAKVIAVNIYGDSFESDVGNGAIIITYADAPLYLQEDLVARDWTSLGLKWEEGPENGGNTISSYVLSMAVGNQAYSVIQSTISPTAQGVTVVTDLTIGLVYKFKV